MITANYLIDIVSGAVRDISFSLEVEEVLFEVLSNDELLINEDDIEAIRLIDNSLFYSGISYRYIDVKKDDLKMINEKKLLSKRISDFSSCYYWSKSLVGLNKNCSILGDSRYLVSSIVDGLDMLKMSNRLVKFSRSLKKKGHASRYDEFNQFRADYKIQQLIVAPNGQELELKTFIKSLR